ncbi:hypothetical protein [Mitsuaria sp. 7]|uniref:hypothetical protein n=1 Tax=Mitsuaria sp. 7 TaxID=1658665 RepID=UPI0007DD035D|nr:hypothetical protein [Mitsuaria sp. 7]ANH68893.1 hypothetical protein ABE85_17315 [Mitsuaria sp. 7]
MVEGISKRLVRAGLSEIEAGAIAVEIQTAISEERWRRTDERWKDYFVLFMAIVSLGFCSISLVRLFAH